MIEAVAIALVMMALDLLTGFAGAVKTNTVRSARMREGLWHKSGSIGIIALAFALQEAASVVDLGIPIPEGGIVIAVCVWIICMELMSNFENLCILNPDITRSPIARILDDTKGEE